MTVFWTSALIGIICVIIFIGLNGFSKRKENDDTKADPESEDEEYATPAFVPEPLPPLKKFDSPEFDCATHEYEYFAQPRAFSNYTTDPQECALCGRKRPGFTHLYRSNSEVAFVCECCLARGFLSETDIECNDSGLLKWRLAQEQPNLPEGEVRSRADKANEILVYKTPPLATIQELEWPCHCGDYCKFLKIAGRPDFERLSPSGDGTEFFFQCLYNMEPKDADWYWENLREDAPNDNLTPMEPEAFLFGCRNCEKHFVFLDIS